MIERPSWPLAVHPRVSAVGDRALILSGKINVGDLLKLHCCVFSNVLCVCRCVMSKSEFQVGIISVVAKLRNRYSSRYNNFQRGICSDSEDYGGLGDHRGTRSRDVRYSTGRTTHLPCGPEGQWRNDMGQNPAKGRKSSEPWTSPWQRRWTLRPWYYWLFSKHVARLGHRLFWKFSLV